MLKDINKIILGEYVADPNLCALAAKKGDLKHYNG
jgi:hypothetical protein